MIEGQERALYATEEVSRKILGADPRTSTQIKFILRSPLSINTINATEGGSIFGDRVKCMTFSEFLKNSK